ncbi:two-component response regulator ORR9-like isoform X2 [Gastrolobium bilobum]|uniref:two-component response regulator ORR9-like isoform X2 n=1 Tax=Gastrolobium bilobum TaxID=150636 RepID=UPI002AB0B113|nr:two-component response regulator ORR9-like isoform X2 [Gastrolobium bilobum]
MINKSVHQLFKPDMEIVDTRKLQLQKEQHFHVLAVDDSVIDRKLLERLLTGSSCKVTCVDSGDKALKYLGLIDDLDNTSSMSLESSPSPPQPLQQEGIKVNLIMTDYCMPGMSGYDLLKRVKGSSWKDVPVVVMSSENVPSRISMCLEGGAEEFLLKPLQLSDLEKLQPYFLKSLDNSREQESANSSIDSDTDNLIINNNNSNNNNSIMSKRKAMSPELPERSRTKMKGLAVV